MRKINKIIIHCSDSDFGDAKLIDGWHRERGWSGIGYHYVICNGYPKNRTFTTIYDGHVEVGRPLEKAGAHCEGDNADSIGICLIGKKGFTGRQITSLKKLCLELMRQYSLTPLDVFGHCERPSGKKQGKTCPNMDMAVFRKELSDSIFTPEAPND